jgi:hypothetical protein
MEGLLCPCDMPSLALPDFQHSGVPLGLWNQPCLRDLGFFGKGMGVLVALGVSAFRHFLWTG